MRKTLLALTLASLSVGAFAQGFTDAQKEQIGQAAAQYLIDHPEFLIKASDNLRKQQIQAQREAQSKAVLANQSELLNDNATPYVGSQNAKINVIEFFDYQCAYCSKMAPVVKNLQEHYPNVRFIFKETPIFGKRWAASEYAAEMGLEVFKHKGSQGYEQYHNGVYATGLMEGKLTTKAVDIQAKKLGVTPKSLEYEAALKKNLHLFSSLGFQGTPAFVVMPSKGANENNVTLVNGANEMALTEAIKHAKP